MEARAKCLGGGRFGEVGEDLGEMGERCGGCVVAGWWFWRLEKRRGKKKKGQRMIKND